MPAGRQAPTGTSTPADRFARTVTDAPCGSDGRTIAPFAVVTRRRLGTSELIITTLGLGTWAIGGGDWILGWGPQNDADSIATIRRAVESGINWLDTAGVYGLGRAETVIGRALHDLYRAERPYIFTTCGLTWDELGNVVHDLRPESIRRQAEASLRRLDVDCIDLYQLGWPTWPESSAPRREEELEDAWDTLNSLQREGKVRFIGASNCDDARLARLQQIAPVTSLQAPYSLLQREIEDRTLPFCVHQDIGVIAYSPMQSGLLSGAMTPDRIDLLPHNDWRRWNTRFQEPMLSRALELVNRLRRVGDQYARSPGEVAIAWTLRHRAVTAAIVGARRARQVDELVGAAAFTLDANDINELEHTAAERG
jgi:aryl-alcohol dehydrogenase-like predicted oxidoreductase